MPATAQTVRWRTDELVKCHLESGEMYQQAFLRIERQGFLSQPVRVDFQTAGGTAEAGQDYEPVAGSFLFQPSLVDFDDALVVVTILDDSLVEFNETIELTLSVGSGASLEGPASAFLVLLDDESLGDETYRDCSPGIVLGKSDGNHAWQQEPAIPYTITATNTGADVTSVELLETVPVQTRFRSDLSTPGWLCSPGPGEGSACRLELGALQRGGIAQAVFTAEVLPDTPPAFEIFNLVDQVPPGLGAQSSVSSQQGLSGPDLSDVEELSSGLFALDYLAGDCTPAGLAICCLRAIAGLDCPCSDGGDSASTSTSEAGTSRGSESLQTLGMAMNELEDLDPLLLYRLRDRVLRFTPGGRRAIDLFYRWVGPMSVASATSSDLRGKAVLFLRSWQPLFRTLVEPASGLDSPTVTAEQIEVLRDYAESMRDATADQGLADAIDRELLRLEPESWIGLEPSEWLAEIDSLSCGPSASALCLANGRFRVEVEWRDFEGDNGRGRAESMSTDTGRFWFFEPENTELVVKVLDGRGINGHFWVYYGALSNVAYTLTVTDTQSGVSKVYSNPSGAFASVGDTAAFPAAVNPSFTSTELNLERATASWFSDVRGAIGLARDQLKQWLRAEGLGRFAGAGPAGSCAAGTNTLCLGAGRFAVQVSWQDFAGNQGSGTAADLSGDTGTFWFFDPANTELIVKVLDGREVNGRFWVFYGALSNVAYTLQVTDTQTGQVRTYRNPAGEFASVGDTAAF